MARKIHLSFLWGREACADNLAQDTSYRAYKDNFEELFDLLETTLFSFSLFSAGA